MTKYGKITIKPYLEEGMLNMGLEKYKQSLFDSASHTIEMAAIEEGDSIRYVNGLNIFAPDVKFLDDTEREAKELQIKDIMIQAERALGGQNIKKDDTDWWNKITKIKPDNIRFWSSDDMKLKLGNEDVTIDPNKSTTDLLKYVAIKAGGYPEVAKNLEDARSRARPPKFFLDELEETASLKIEVKALRNKAGAMLQTLYDKNANKLMYVCKVIDVNSPQYKKSTPLAVMYNNMDMYIGGETVDKDKRKTAQYFLDVAEMSMETLKLRAMVKDATFFRYIALKGDGMLYDMETGTALGKNPTQVVEYFKNPLNDELLKRFLNKVEAHWKE